MGYLKAPSDPDHPLPEEGEHVAIFRRFEDLGYIVTDYDQKHGNDRKRWTMNFIFELEGGIEQSYEVYPSLGASKFLTVIKALLQKDPPREMKTEDFLPTLIGKKCLVTIKRYGNQLAVIRNEDGEDVRPMTASGRTNAYKNTHGTMVDDSMVPF